MVQNATKTKSPRANANTSSGNHVGTLQQRSPVGLFLLRRWAPLASKWYVSLQSSCSRSAPAAIPCTACTTSWSGALHGTLADGPNWRAASVPGVGAIDQSAASANKSLLMYAHSSAVCHATDILAVHAALVPGACTTSPRAWNCATISRIVTRPNMSAHAQQNVNHHSHTGA